MLHQVARAVQGPVDSVTAGPRGEFRFRFLPDTAAVYLLSSGYAGIEYFSTPVHADPAAPDTGLLLVVSDTSSSAPLRILSRHIVIGRPQKDGSRPALEIVVLANNGPDTRVATETQPSWAARLPKGVRNFEVGSGDVSGDAMIARNDSVVLEAPVAPGEKQLLFTYQVPPGVGTMRIPVGDSVDVMNVLLEEFDRTVTGGGIAKADSQSIEGRSFRQWNGPVPAGSVVSIDFPGARLTWLLPLLVGSVAVSLLVLALRTLRRQPAMAPVSGRHSSWTSLPGSTPGMPDAKHRSPPRNGRSISGNGLASNKSSQLSLPGRSRRLRLAPQSQLIRTRVGTSEAGVNPARPRHCNGQQYPASHATGKPGRRAGGPKPGDLSTRATTTPSGEGRVAIPATATRLCSAHLRTPGDGRSR